MGIGVSGRIGGDDRQFLIESHLDQPRLGGLLDRVASAAQLDIEAAREQGLQALEHRCRCLSLAGSDQTREGTLSSRGERDQALGSPLECREGDMGILLDWAAEMGLGNQSAQIDVAAFVLGVDRQPVDDRLIGTGDRQHRTDDRLHALAETGVAERHHAIETVAVGYRRGGKIELARLLGDRLWVDRPFKHRITGEDSQRNVRRGHGPVMGSRSK